MKKIEKIRKMVWNENNLWLLGIIPLVVSFIETIRIVLVGNFETFYEIEVLYAGVLSSILVFSVIAAALRMKEKFFNKN